MSVNTSTTLPEALVDPLQRSLAALDAESQTIRQALVAKEQNDKQTKTTYARHVASYEAWWDQSQHKKLAEDPFWTAIPAFPITVAKAVVFLDYETTRPQVSQV